jgi:hypothetical protein
MSHPINCPFCGTGPGYPGACQCDKSAGIAGMKATFRPMHPVEDGWCEWVQPTQGYKTQCCDCGLVHEMEFKAFAETKQQADGAYEIVELPWPIRVMFRARRQVT